MSEIVSKTYGVKEAAALLGCSEWKVYKMCKDGQLPHFKVGSTLRFTDINLSKWMRSKEAASCRNKS